MRSELIFVPVLLQVLLTIFLYFILANVKKKAIAAGEVDEERRGLYDDAWPVSVIKVNNCIRNQFELPVLFYVLIAALWALGAVNIVSHVLAWIYIVSRFIHAYIQTGSNFVPLRLRFFKISMFSVLLLTAAALFAVLS